MLTREDKEKIVRESNPADLMETLIDLVTRGAHDCFTCDHPDRDELVERFSVTRNEILRRMEAAGVVERDSSN